MTKEEESQEAPRIEPGEIKLPPELEVALRETAEMGLAERAIEGPSIYEGLLFAGAVLVGLSLVTPWAEVQGQLLRGWKMSQNLPPSSVLLIVGGGKWLKPFWLFPLYALLSLFLYRRTKRRFWGLVSSSFLTASAIYLILYFLCYWRWTLPRHFFGSWAMVVGLSFFGLAGIERFRQIEGSSFSRKALFLAGVLLLSGFLLPWMLKSTGLNLLLELNNASWWSPGRSNIWAYGIGLFPLWGLLAIIKGTQAKGNLGPWSIFFLIIGAISLTYFFIFWRPFTGQFMVGLWGTVLGLVLVTFGGLEDYAKQKGLSGGLFLTLGFIILGVYLYALWTGEDLISIFKSLGGLWGAR